MRRSREMQKEEGYPPGMKPAGFWIRFLARLIDGLIFALVFGILNAALTAVLNVSSPTGVAFWLYLPQFLIFFLYETLMTASRGQGTVGKQALSIKVIGSTGERLSYAHSVGRYFASILSGITLYVGYIMAAFMPRKQALHDLVASTYVIHAGGQQQQFLRKSRAARLSAQLESSSEEDAGASPTEDDHSPHNPEPLG